MTKKDISKLRKDVNYVIRYYDLGPTYKSDSACLYMECHSLFLECYREITFEITIHDQPLGSQLTEKLDNITRLLQLIQVQCTFSELRNLFRKLGEEL